MEHSASRTAAGMAVLYFLVAVVGAYVGDRFLEMYIGEAELPLSTHIIEDSTIAALTALVIFFVLSREFGKRIRAQDELQQARSELERRVAERTAEIDAQRHLLQAVVDNAPAGIVVLDGTHLRVKWANHGYLQFLEEPYRSSGIVGSSVQDFIPRAEESGVADIFRQVGRTCQPYVTTEFEHVGFARGVTYWRWSLVPLGGDSTACPDLLLSVSEITEQVAGRKQVEELRAEAERRAADLEVRVQARTAELAEANERLEQRVGERTREMSTLLDISHTVSSTLDLQPLLDLILNQLAVMIDYTGAAVFARSGDEIAIIGYHGPLPRESVEGFAFSLQQAPLYRKLLDIGGPILVPDLDADTPLAIAQREEASLQFKQTIGASRSLLLVPLLAKDKMIGMLRLDHLDPGHFTPHHSQLALAIANEAAVAIENARLYADAQKLAALEERQRLARELHDSVSQALYGIALGTHAAREMLVRQSPQASEALDYVLTQANAAVDEMRALIFELRPEALAEEGLVAALNKQVSAFRARSGITASIDLSEDATLSKAAEEALYRIAQEALHNIYKHARAGNVELRLYQERDGIALDVTDDGQGFDPAGSFPGHLGLPSMRQRAAHLGGTVDITSRPGHGTSVRAWLPMTKG